MHTRRGNISRAFFGDQEELPTNADRFFIHPRILNWQRLGVKNLGGNERKVVMNLDFDSRRRNIVVFFCLNRNKGGKEHSQPLIVLKENEEF